MDPTTNEEWAALCRAQIETIERLATAKNTAEQRVAEMSNLLVVSEAARTAGPTVKQLAAQLGSDEKWTVAEQKAFAPFLERFPNECSQGIISLGSAWKHGIAYAQSLAAAPQQHAQAADGPRYIAEPNEFQTKILHAMYRAAQKGDSIERMHFDVCAILAASHQPAAAPEKTVYQVLNMGMWDDVSKEQYDRCNPDYRRIRVDHGATPMLTRPELRSQWAVAAAPAIQQEGAALNEQEEFRKWIFSDGMGDIFVKSAWAAWKARAALAAPLQPQPAALADAAPPEFSRDPDGDLCIDYRGLSISFSKTGMVSWAVEGASGSEQVAPVADAVPVEARLYTGGQFIRYIIAPEGFAVCNIGDQTVRVYRAIAAKPAGESA